jgi:hypothetical protein
MWNYALKKKDSLYADSTIGLFKDIWAIKQWFKNNNIDIKSDWKITPHSNDNVEYYVQYFDVNDVLYLLTVYKKVEI